MKRLLGSVLFLAAACTGTPCPSGASQCPAPPPPGTPAWSTVLDTQDLPGVVLSIWGSGPNHVVLAGGALGNGAESLAIQLKDNAWTTLHPGGTETYWWTHGSSAQDIWFVGEHGRISQFNGSTFTEHHVPTQATLWGVMAFSPQDVWVVGGAPENSIPGNADLVFHFDGTTWTQETLPGTPRNKALFKVWGPAPGDIFIVGEGGTIWHRSNGVWVDQSNAALARGTLFTVHGCGPQDVYAVGGATLLHFDGTAWSKVGVEIPGSANGVACQDGGAMVVGFGGLKLRLKNGTWEDASTLEPYEDLHAAWADGAGAYVVSGGEWVSRARVGTRRLGVVARFGVGVLPGSVSP